MAAARMLSILFVLAVSPAIAQETGSDKPVFPPGSSFGLIPFEGSEMAFTFAGFANQTGDSVMMTEFTLEDFDEAAPAVRDPALWAKKNIEVAEIEDIAIDGFKALRISGTQTVQGATFPKCMVFVRGEKAAAVINAQMLRSTSGDACALISGIAERDPPTLAQRIEALPFAFDDLGGMRIVNVTGRSAATLTKGPSDVLADAPDQPMMIVVRSYGGVLPPEDRRLDFSVRSLHSVAGHRDFEIIEQSEIKVYGEPGIQIIATAVEISTGQEVKLVQSIGFGPQDYMRLVGFSPVERWAENEADFAAVLAGLTVK